MSKHFKYVPCVYIYMYMCVYVYVYIAVTVIKVVNKPITSTVFLLSLQSSPPILNLQATADLLFVTVD